MSLATVVTLGFRCKKCWQVTSAPSDQVGQEVPCLCCQSPVVVPEADDQTIAAGEAFAETSTDIDRPQVNFDEQVSEAQIFANVKQEMLDNLELGGLPASRIQRFLGSVIDGFAAMAAITAGFIVAMIVTPESGIGSVVIVMTLPTMLTLIQCNLIATEGRTIGKYCVKTRIVNQLGDPPGFVQGVLIRCVATMLLGMIPFFSLVDALWIFNSDANRCLHDYLAGTHVIDAS